PPWALLSGGLVLIAGVIAAVIILSAGGDDDPAAASGTATPTSPASDDFGQPPVMTPHIHTVSPDHAGRIQKAQTVERPNSSSGVCAEVTYQDLPQNNLMFQVAVDGEIVTPSTTVEIIEGTFEDPKRGRICYATPEGLALGVHSAAVAVQDPNNLTGPPTEVVGWKFEVIE
ncbi:MAG: hypothetical protein WED87_08455, partial [Dehalococcoidia bacterium]